MPLKGRFACHIVRIAGLKGRLTALKGRLAALNERKGYIERDSETTKIKK